MAYLNSKENVHAAHTYYAIRRKSTRVGNNITGLTQIVK